MIDIDKGTLVSLRQVPRHLPPRANGKRVHISAVYRWASRGVKGVVLESVKLGGTTYTTIEALQRFADRLSEVRNARNPRPGRTLTRERQLEQARRRLDDELGAKP